MDPLMNFNFEVTADAVVFRVSKVTDIGQTVEVEEVKEGGLNGSVHTLVRPASGNRKLVFERGFCASDDLQSMEKLLGVLHGADKPMVINIFNQKHELAKSYTVQGWMVTSWKLGELDAARGGVLLETVEVVCASLKSGQGGW